MPFEDKNEFSTSEERRSHLPPHIPIEEDAIGAYYDSLSPGERREFAIGLAIGNAALTEALAKDPKTGLLQPVAFKSRVVSMTSIHPKAEAEANHGLIVCDLDDFKALNSRLGHHDTDEAALIPAARSIAAHVREDQDIVGRFGGEEFVIFLSHTDRADVELVAHKLQDAINGIEPLPGERLGISMGWAVFPQGARYDDIFTAADNALLDAKKIEGKNKILEAGNDY